MRQPWGDNRHPSLDPFGSCCLQKTPGSEDLTRSTTIQNPNSNSTLRMFPRRTGRLPVEGTASQCITAEPGMQTRPQHTRWPLNSLSHRPSEDLILHACFPTTETASPRRFSTLHFHETGHADAAWEYGVTVDRVRFPG